MYWVWDESKVGGGGIRMVLFIGINLGVWLYVRRGK